ncbi:MAG: hypothetical protein HPY66_3331 [Firmicutes bacterium]|nr:hypothetical protein [Bacillota bacterium]MDI6706921.1 4Fe-4S binding protein [Bacillota bacterium]
MILGVVNEKCSGCRTCQALCSLQNLAVWNPKKAALKVIPRFPKPGEYEVGVCNQCGVCAKICPAEAIYRDRDVYLINEEECTGCGLCVEACPNNVMVMLGDMKAPFKCNGCGECISYCPREALYDVCGGDKK